MACAEHDRDPDSMKIATLMYPVVAETRAEAEDKKAAYDKLPNDMDSLSLLSEALNFDFASKGLDEAFTDDEIEGIAGMQGMRDRVLQLSGKRNPYPGKLGIIQEGALADLLLVDGDPMANIQLLGDPEKNFVVIMKDGKIYKNTLK